jgi:ABC-type anion transport system duplicated permease subunit
MHLDANTIFLGICTMVGGLLGGLAQGILNLPKGGRVILILVSVIIGISIGLLLTWNRQLSVPVLPSTQVTITPATVRYPVPRLLVDRLRYGVVSGKSVKVDCIDVVHEQAFEFYGFRTGEIIPANALVATNFGEVGQDFRNYPVDPVCYAGSSGLFVSLSEYTAPYEGAYWNIIP